MKISIPIQKIVTYLLIGLVLTQLFLLGYLFKDKYQKVQLSAGTVSVLKRLKLNTVLGEPRLLSSEISGNPNSAALLQHNISITYEGYIKAIGKDSIEIVQLQSDSVTLPVAEEAQLKIYCSVESTECKCVDKASCKLEELTPGLLVTLQNLHETDRLDRARSTNILVK